jgi:hypothetical protein
MDAKHGSYDHEYLQNFLHRSDGFTWKHPQTWIPFLLVSMFIVCSGAAGFSSGIGLDFRA